MPDTKTIFTTAVIAALTVAALNRISTTKQLLNG